MDHLRATMKPKCDERVLPTQILMCEKPIKPKANFEMEGSLSHRPRHSINNALG